MAGKRRGKRKKKTPSDKTGPPRADRRPPSDGESGPSPFDPRAMERVLRDVTTGGSERDRTPLEQAQDVLYEALGAEGDERVALAEQALAISPDCADAYVLLAEDAPTPEAAAALYEEGVAAGRRALGEDGFRECTGEFWGILETRPYMRAREGLAQCLWVIGRRDEAIEHYTEMLELNPGDNQGIRYLLAHALLDEDRDAELQSLLAEYEDDVRADWTYTRALAAFRAAGDTAEAVDLLKNAVEHNEHVPNYLLGNQPMPAEPPEYVSLGAEDEAVMYAAQFLPAWRNTPGALTWLRRSLKVPVAESPARRMPDWRKMKKLLASLPRDEEEVWQVDARQYPGEIAVDDDDVVTPWFVCVADAQAREVVAFEVEDERPSRRTLWETLVQTMLHPRRGDPRRPAAIEFRLKSLAKAWSKRLSQVDIECRWQSDLDCVEEFLAQAPSLEELDRMIEETPELTDLEQLDLNELPLYPEVVWQADVRRMTTWLEDDGSPVRPRIAAVANCVDGTVIGHDISVDASATELLWEVLLRSLWHPAVGDPCRPGEIQVLRPEQRDTLASRLADFGIEVTCQRQLDVLQEMLAELDRAMQGPEQPLSAMVDSPGVTAEQVGRFFAAADRFYRAAPWRRIAGETVIRVEAGQLASEPRYAVVMGQSGMSVGLVIYEDLDLLRDLLSGVADEEEGGRKTSGLSVFFDDELQMASGDLDAAETFGWPVAGPEAYPVALRINPGMSVRPPLAWELSLANACLQAIPMLVEAEAERVLVRLSVDENEVEMQLSWFDPFAT